MSSSSEVPEAIRAGASALAAVRKRPCLLLLLPHVCRAEATRVRGQVRSLGGPSIDVILSSGGGCIEGAYLVGRELQRTADHVTVYVPYLAKSAATLVALAADELVLGPFGELGPLDVQSLERRKADTPAGTSGLLPLKGLEQLTQSALSFYEASVKQVMEGTGMSPFDAGTKATELSGALFGPLFGQIDPLRLADSARGLEVPIEYGLRLVRRRRPEVLPQAEQALRRLVHDYPSHTFVIDRNELAELGLLARGPAPEEATILGGVCETLMACEETPDVVELILPPGPEQQRPAEEGGKDGDVMTFDEAIKAASRAERFMATVYAMNSLMLAKGIYGPEEFERLFVEWMVKEGRKRRRPRAERASGDSG